MFKLLSQYFEFVILKDELAVDYEDTTSSFLHLEVVE